MECFDEREKDANGLSKPLRWEAFVIEWLPKLLELTDRRENWDRITKLGTWYDERVLISAAEVLWRRVLKWCEEIHGSEHQSTIRYIDCLSITLMEKGESREAEKLVRRVVDWREKNLGRHHEETVRSVVNLASLLSNKGDDQEACSLAQRALDDCDNLVGIDRDDLIIIKGNIGSLFVDLGLGNRGGQILMWALRSSEREFGRNHMLTLSSALCFAGFLETRGKHKSSEIIYRRVWSGARQSLGELHPISLDASGRLANVLLENDCVGQAEDILRWRLDLLDGHFGLLHPNTVVSAESLGLLLGRKGEYDSAVFYLKRAVSGYEALFGRGGPHVLDCLENLAVAARHQGDLVEAVSICRKVFEGREKALGIEHQDTLKSLRNLASLIEECTDDGVQTSPQVRIDSNSSVCFVARGNLESELLYEEFLERLRNNCGKWSFRVSDVCSDLAAMSWGIRDLSRANKYFILALACGLRNFGYSSEVIDNYYSAAISGYFDLDFQRPGVDVSGLERLVYFKVKWMIKLHGSDSNESKEALEEYGDVVRRQNSFLWSILNYKEAARISGKLVTLKSLVLGDQSEEAFGSILSMVQDLVKSGDFTGAEKRIGNILSYQISSLGLAHKDVLHSVKIFAEILLRLGEHSRAENFLTGIVGDMIAGGLDERDVDQIKELIVKVLDGCGKKREAEALLDGLKNIEDEWASVFPGV